MNIIEPILTILKFVVAVDKSHVAVTCMSKFWIVKTWLGLCRIGRVLLKIELIHSLTQCYFNVMPLFTPLPQHQANIGIALSSSGAWACVVIQCWLRVVPALQRRHRPWANIEPTLGRFSHARVYSVDTLTPAWSTAQFWMGDGRRWRLWTSIEPALG